MILKSIVNKPVVRVIKSVLKNKLNRPTPFFAVWEITSNCNMKCDFCNRWRYSSKHYPHELKTNECYDIIDQLSEIGVGIINFGGGEPLMRQDFPSILKYAKENGMITLINTNGYFLKDKIDSIKNNVDYIRISLDSIKLHNKLRGKDLAFKKAIIGIKITKKANCNVSINSTITKSTFLEMEQLVKLAINLSL